MLLGITVAVLLLGVGLVHAVYLGVQSFTGSAEDQAQVPGDAAGGRRGVVAGEARRDRIAAAPMLSVPAKAAQAGGTPALASVGVPIRVPTPTVVGSAGVWTGFPRTPAGAVGQLAQIETAVLQRMSLRHALAVHAAWSLPGGVDGNDWQLTRNVQAFLSSARITDEAGAATASVTAIPAAAMIKGTDGPDWTVACVLLRVDAVVSARASIGYGYCERMQWVTTTSPQAARPPASAANGAVGGRWMIAPGEPAALAPSTWPGTELAVQAGWCTWQTTAPTVPAGDAGDGLDAAGPTSPRAAAGSGGDRGPMDGTIR